MVFGSCKHSTLPLPLEHYLTTVTVGGGIFVLRPMVTTFSLMVSSADGTLKKKNRFHLHSTLILHLSGLSVSEEME